MRPAYPAPTPSRPASGHGTACAQSVLDNWPFPAKLKGER
jgi:hypothetical protein